MVTYKGTAQRNRAKKVPTDDGLGIKWIHDGVEKGDITLEIDVARIARYLGEKALQNRTKKSGCLNGMITAKASNIRSV